MKHKTLTLLFGFSFVVLMCVSCKYINTNKTININTPTINVVGNKSIKCVVTSINDNNKMMDIKNNDGQTFIIPYNNDVNVDDIILCDVDTNGNVVCYFPHQKNDGSYYSWNNYGY